MADFSFLTLTPLMQIINTEKCSFEAIIRSQMDVLFYLSKVLNDANKYVSTMLLRRKA